MTTPTPEQIASIVAGLTKPQATALWNLGVGQPEFHNGWRLAPHDGWRRAGHACTSLVAKGLAERMNGDCGPMYRLNDLGEAVRAHLQKGAS